jgi:hypothetical protein
VYLQLEVQCSIALLSPASGLQHYNNPFTAELIRGIVHIIVRQDAHQGITRRRENRRRRQGEHHAYVYFALVVREGPNADERGTTGIFLFHPTIPGYPNA